MAGSCIRHGGRSPTRALCVAPSYGCCEWRSPSVPGATERPRWLWSELFRSERAAEGLIPRLRSRHPDQFVLIVASIQVEMGEKLCFGEGIGGVDTEKRLRPRWLHPGGAAHFDPAADSEPV